MPSPHIVIDHGDTDRRAETDIQWLLNVTSHCSCEGGDLAQRLFLAGLLVLGLAFASPSHAQERITDVDAFSCSTDPQGLIYFSFAGLVLAFSPDDLDNFELDVRTIIDPPRSPEAWQSYLDHWPAPRNANVPIGCPENPIWSSLIQFSLTHERLGFETPTHRQTEVIEYSNDRGWSIPAEVPILVLSMGAGRTSNDEPPFRTLERALEFCDVHRLPISKYLTACHRFRDPNESFWFGDIYQFFYVVDQDKYSFPGGDLFFAFCRNSIHGAIISRCPISYMANYPLMMNYVFSMPRHPTHQLIPVDSAFRDFINQAFRPELSDLTAGVANNFPLPTLDHHQLIETEFEADNIGFYDSGCSISADEFCPFKE